MKETGWIIAAVLAFALSFVIFGAYGASSWENRAVKYGVFQHGGEIYRVTQAEVK